MKKMKQSNINAAKLMAALILSVASTSVYANCYEMVKSSTRRCIENGGSRDYCFERSQTAGDECIAAGERTRQNLQQQQQQRENSYQQLQQQQQQVYVLPGMQ